MTPRAATPDDADMIARIHVQSWQEAYPSLLPEAEIAARNFAYRQSIWTRALAQGTTRIGVIDDIGFAQIGPQREDEWSDKGYPEELWAMYLLRRGYGQGSPLLQATYGAAGRPFTACVIDGNARACAFYEKAGGQLLTTKGEMIGKTAIIERTYGWTDAPFST